MGSLPLKIGRYSVVGHLATGGMAEILLGKLLGPSGFQRPVVIKRILPHLARHQTFVNMFLDEGRIGAEIRHPNVAQVLDLGRDGDELFLVMEYLEGESAAGLFRRLGAQGRHLGYDLCANVVAQVCAGLHAAHELVDGNGVRQQLVHRDVSPQNIFLCYSGEVKVLDFGIAQAASRLHHTETGQIKGKFAYMSPEQCSGGRLDPRSDIFSLGIVLYELSTGRRLFGRPNEMMVLKAVCELPIPHPSRLLAGYPPALEAIVMRALSRPLEQRFGSAAEMRRDLIGFLRTRPTAEPQEAMAKLLGELFAERVEQKRTMLRRVEAGSSVTHIPAAEVDEEVEVPIIEVTLSGGSRRRRRLRRVAAAAVLVTGALAVTAFGFRSSIGSLLPGRARATNATPTTIAPVPSASPALGFAPPRVPSSVQVRVESNPPGAFVRVGGRPSGRTPTVLWLPRSDEAVAIEVDRPGYRRVQETLTPDVDQRLRLTLVREGRSPRRRSGRPSAGPSQDLFRAFR